MSARLWVCTCVLMKQCMSAASTLPQKPRLRRLPAYRYEHGYMTRICRVCHPAGPPRELRCVAAAAVIAERCSATSVLPAVMLLAKRTQASFEILEACLVWPGVACDTSIQYHLSPERCCCRIVTPIVHPLDAEIGVPCRRARCSAPQPDWRLYWTGHATGSCRRRCALSSSRSQSGATWRSSPSNNTRMLLHVPAHRDWKILYVCC